MAEVQPPPETVSPDPDRLYDEYLEACLEGRATDPQTFLEERGGGDTELLVRLERLQRMVSAAETRGTPAPPGTSSPDEELPYERMGPYRLERRIGVGGMGAVFVAVHEALDRRVALKVIRPDLQTDLKTQRRFRQEAMAVARLRHPGIVNVHDFGTDHGTHYCAMEFVRGRPLYEILHEGLPDPNRATRWAVSIARALDYAHAHGVVHRDVKPNNILITADDRPVLLDFGVAHLMEFEGTRLTSGFTGTPSYAAPEQITPEFGEVDGRTDVYGLGATFYECLTGQLPFEGGTVQNVFRRVLSEDPVPPSRLRPTLSAAYDLVTLKALEKQPAARYASAVAMGDDLEALAGDTAIQATRPGPLRRVAKWARRRPVRAATLATALAAALALGVISLYRSYVSVRERHEQAVRLLQEARFEVERYRTLREETEKARQQAERYQRRMTKSFTEEAEERKYEDALRAVRNYERERDAIYYEVQELVKRAERTDAAVSGGDEIVARLHVERLEEEREKRDPAAEAVYLDIIRKHDPDGRLLAELTRKGRLSVLAQPPGVEVILFRSREQAEVVEGGQRRLVPVPYGDAPTPVPPGTWALRVVKGAGGIEAGDIILEVAGHRIEGTVLADRSWRDIQRGDRLHALLTEGEEILVPSQWHLQEYRDDAKRAVFERDGQRYTTTGPPDGVGFVEPEELVAVGDAPVKVFRQGGVESSVAPRGLLTRPTAAPYFITASSRVGTTPLEGLEIAPGNYVVMLRHVGHESVVFPVWIAPGKELRVTGPLLEQVPDSTGWVYVPGVKESLDGSFSIELAQGFWIMERELSCQEYMEFLNDEETLREIRASSTPIRFPRSPWDAARGGVFKRDAGGRYITGEQGPRWPIAGVSYDDAVAYARWRSKRDDRAYGLPTFQNWILAARGLSRREFVFGNVYRPKWMKSEYARPRACIEIAMRFPVDESPCGVYDLSGNLAEWLESFFSGDSGPRRLAGGHFGLHAPELFQITAGIRSARGITDYCRGFRLVLPPGGLR